MSNIDWSKLITKIMQDNTAATILFATLTATENQWRQEQMPIALDNVTAIDFGDDSIPGTVAEWKAYWLLLRKWTNTNPDFPEINKRPVAPS